MADVAEALPGHDGKADEGGEQKTDNSDFSDVRFAALPIEKRRPINFHFFSRVSQRLVQMIIRWLIFWISKLLPFG